jgi:hypothetical protein
MFGMLLSIAASICRIGSKTSAIKTVVLNLPPWDLKICLAVAQSHR